MTARLGESSGNANAAQQFADNPYSRDTRENVSLAHFEAFAIKSLIDARTWWGKRESSSFMFDEMRENLFEQYTTDEETLTKEAEESYFDYLRYQRHDSEVLDLVRNCIAREMLWTRGSGRAKLILAYRTKPQYDEYIRRSDVGSAYDTYFSNGKAVFVDSNGRYIRTLGGPDTSIALADQINKDIYEANGAEQPAFRSYDFKTNWNEAGTTKAVKRTASNLPGIEAVEETRFADKKDAKNPNNRFFEVNFRLMPMLKPKQESQEASACQAIRDSNLGTE